LAITYQPQMPEGQPKKQRNYTLNFFLILQWHYPKIPWPHLLITSSQKKFITRKFLDFF